MIKELKLSKLDTKYYIEGIGYVVVRKIYENADITDVFIEESYRRKGYGLKLISHVIEKNKDSKIMLEVKISNAPAISLYEKAGFVKIGERKKYYNNETALIMEYKK